MKGLANILGVLGVLIVIYAVVGRFVGGATIGLGIIGITAKAALILANSLILVALFIKSSK
ncbi:MAG: hypothetical protein HQ572_00160 [Candidatus Omnitrophica bacterium]|nr:hypothetical protein [Candidatus Omnitrophota bacterium]